MENKHNTESQEYDAIIIGSGLGGLLCGAYISDCGYKILIIERLPFIGGRFANIAYKGFQLSTGAVHMIPHRRGLISRALQELNLNVEIRDAGKAYILKNQNEFNKMDDAYIISSLIRYPFFEDVKRVYDAFYRFSIGINTSELSLSQKLKYFNTISKFGRPATIVGGCSSIINSLAQKIRDNGGVILNDTEAIEILTDKNKAKGVIVERNKEQKAFYSDIIISNMGPRQTSRLIGQYLNQEVDRPVGGIKINLSCSKVPFKGHSLVITPNCRRIAGVVVPSIVDPDMAPPGKHLIMSHQEIMSDDIDKEIQLGLEDLKNLIPNFDEDCEVIAIQTFREDWPVNRTPQGKEYDILFAGLENLYLVGDAVMSDEKANLHIMTEGVISGAKKVSENVLEVLNGIKN